MQIPGLRGPAVQAGVSLVEAMVVITLLAVLIQVAVPWAAQATDGLRSSLHANEFLGSLHMARSEAIKRGQRVVVCKAAPSQGCSSAGDWSQGWIVFVDADNNAHFDSAKEPLLQRVAPLSGGFRLQGNTHVANYVSYTPLGRNRQVNGALQNGTVTLCKPGAEAAPVRLLRINNAGRVRAERDAPGGCS